MKSQHSCICKVSKETENQGKTRHNEVHIVIEIISRALKHRDSAKKTRMKYDKSIKTTGRKKGKLNITEKLADIFCCSKVTG